MKKSGPKPAFEGSRQPQREVEAWSALDDWLLVELGLVCVVDWLAETPPFTLWLPLPTCTPGLMLAPAFTGLLLMFALASTPTFGFALIDVPLELVLGEVAELLLGDVADEELVPGDVEELLGVLLLEELGDVLELELEPLMLLPVLELLLPDRVVSALLEVEPLSVPEPVIDVFEDGGVVVVVLLEGELEIVVSVVLEPVVLLTLLSGMQSMWTGLRECSFALPVSLSASLPAFGWCSSLHSGRLLVVVVDDVDGSVVVENVDEVDGCVVVVEVDGLVVVDEFSEADPLSELFALWLVLPLSEEPEDELSLAMPEALVEPLALLEPFVPLEPVLLLAPLVPLEPILLLEVSLLLELLALFLLRSLELEVALSSASTGVAAKAPTTAAARILRVNGFM